MIKVKVKYENGIIKTIKMNGHAKYDEYGKDIVCAGISSALITTVNACLRLDNESIKYVESPFLLENIKQDQVTNKLLENLVEILKEIKENYKKNIIVEEE